MLKCLDFMVFVNKKHTVRGISVAQKHSRLIKEARAERPRLITANRKAAGAIAVRYGSAVQNDATHVTSR